MVSGSGQLRTATDCNRRLVEGRDAGSRWQGRRAPVQGRGRERGAVEVVGPRGAVADAVADATAARDERGWFEGFHRGRGSLKGWASARAWAEQQSIDRKPRVVHPAFRGPSILA